MPIRRYYEPGAIEKLGTKIATPDPNHQTPTGFSLVVVLTSQRGLKIAADVTEGRQCNDFYVHCGEEDRWADISLYDIPTEWLASCPTKPDFKAYMNVRIEPNAKQALPVR